MKKYSTLRKFLKKFKNLQEDHVLKDCPLIVDGDSVFRRTYKSSFCKFILGGEMDRYAYHLKKILTPLIESNVTCYVIFSGAKKLDIESRKKIHQKLIDVNIAIVPGDDQYYEPVFVKDVIKQVLEELGIKYAVCEYDVYKTLLDVSRAYNCPVLSNNIEICLMFMSCITPDSLVYGQEQKLILCQISTSEAFYHRQCKIHHTKKPLFMAIIDETGPLFKKIPEIVGFMPKKGTNPAGYLMYWVKRIELKEANSFIGNLLATDEERKIFEDSIAELSMIFFSPRDYFAIKHFRSQKNYSIYKDINMLFRSGVMTGKIAIPYINLRNGTFPGSWVICDESKRDAMQPAMDIVMDAYDFLSKYHNEKPVTFIKRIGDKTDLELVKPTNRFHDFADKVLKDFNWLDLNKAPEESWLLIITLVYCMTHIEDFIDAAYSILLSYVMLGPVSEKVGLIKRTKLNSCLNKSERETNNECTYEDSLTGSKALLNYFYEGDLTESFDRSALHDLAEFQHCLQHINYVNKLYDSKMWGGEVKCTTYHKTYNGTFVYNILLHMRQYRSPVAFIKHHLNTCPSVLKFYLKIKGVFESCLMNLYGEEICNEQFKLSL